MCAARRVDIHQPGATGQRLMSACPSQRRQHTPQRQRPSERQRQPACKSGRRRPSILRRCLLRACAALLARPLVGLWRRLVLADNAGRLLRLGLLLIIPSSERLRRSRRCLRRPRLLSLPLVRHLGKAQDCLRGRVQTSRFRSECAPLAALYPSTWTNRTTPQLVPTESNCSAQREE